VAFDRDQIKYQLAQLAASGVFIGTSSWKYAGWMGMLYDPARYEYRGKFAFNPLVKPVTPNPEVHNMVDRASEFGERCGLLNIEGVTMHSYRYAWAKRAKKAG